MASQGPSHPGRVPRVARYGDHAPGRAEPAPVVHRAVLGPGNLARASARQAATARARIAVEILEAAARTARAWRSRLVVDDGRARSSPIAAATLPSASFTGAATAEPEASP